MAGNGVQGAMAGHAHDADPLERFVEAQEGVYERALGELRAGLQRGHWMWFVFPQLRGLGRSAQSAFYGIRGLEEARRYLAHPVLGPRLEAATRCVLQAGVPPPVIFGRLDAMKFISCITLFAQAAGADSVFADALRTCGLEDRLTLEALSIESGGA